MSSRARKLAHEKRMERQERDAKLTQAEKTRLNEEAHLRRYAKKSAPSRVYVSSGKVYSQKKQVAASSRPTFDVETQNVDEDFLRFVRSKPYSFEGLTGVEAAELAARLVYLAMYHKFVYRPLPYRVKDVDQDFRQHLEAVAPREYGDILTAYNSAIQEYESMYDEADDNDVDELYDIDRKVVHSMMTPEEVEDAVKEDARVAAEKAERAAQEALRAAEEAARIRAEAEALEAARLASLRQKVPTREDEYKEWLRERTKERKQRMAELQPLYTTDSKLYWEKVGEINAEEARDKEIGLQFKKSRSPKKPAASTKSRSRR